MVWLSYELCFVGCRLLYLFLYHAGDVFYVNWDEVLGGATAVVSTIGGFGNEEQMKRINGEANVVAVNAAKDFGKCCQDHVELFSFLLYVLSSNINSLIGHTWL